MNIKKAPTKDMASACGEILTHISYPYVKIWNYLKSLSKRAIRDLLNSTYLKNFWSLLHSTIIVSFVSQFLMWSMFPSSLKWQFGFILLPNSLSPKGILASLSTTLETNGISIFVSISVNITKRVGYWI